MGEPTCVMHAFCYTSGVTSEAKEDNHIYALEESVSLGRFMSESLSWEKWSSFSRNRYVEEAEKYSRPGSVKQKKAYFEAHFKRMAALKAAALLEQANAAQGGAPDEPNPESEVHNDGSKNEDQADPHAQPPIDQQWVEKEAEKSGFVDNHNEHSPYDGEDQLNTKIMKETDHTAEVESTEHLMDVEKPNPSTEMENGMAKTKESHSKCSTISQDILAAASPRSKRNPPLSAYIPSSPKKTRNPKLSSYMPSIEPATSLVSSSSPAKSAAQPPVVHPGKENTATPIGRKSLMDEPSKNKTPLRMSINRELNRLISPVIKKIGSSSKASNKDCSSPLRTPVKASVDGMTTTPQSGNRRARALFDSSGCESKAAGPRWQFLSAGGAKSPSGGRNKTGSPIIAKSFCLGSTERAPRRKKRLEEKFNVQQQSKLKEKPKELAKLRQSFCFGAKLSSESFREKERLEVPSESEVTDDQLPKKGRSRLRNMTALPPRRPAFKGTKNAKEKEG